LAISQLLELPSLALNSANIRWPISSIGDRLLIVIRQREQFESEVSDLRRQMKRHGSAIILDFDNNFNNRPSNRLHESLQFADGEIFQAWAIDFSISVSKLRALLPRCWSA
jgi:hypothetical protein